MYKKNINKYNSLIINKFTKEDRYFSTFQEVLNLRNLSHELKWWNFKTPFNCRCCNFNSNYWNLF